MEALLSILGSIASIFGAGWALREARKAARSAAAAAKVRDELIDRRKLTELAQIHIETKRVLALVAKVGQTSTPQLVKGVNCAEIAREVESFASMLLEQRSHFSDIYADKATELRDDLRPDVQGLAAARTFEDKKRFGTSIYLKLENFTPVVKQLTEEKREHSARL
jgi:hypothetical protein